MGEDKIRYRHELKYLINYGEKEILADRLKNIAGIDSHASENGYLVRSLYFDDVWHSSYEEKLMGVVSRRKYRIRIYDYSDSHIALECKEKQGAYIYKYSAELTRQETEDIINGKYECLEGKTDQLLKEFYLLLKSGMRPEVIVDYDRLPFVYAPGTVRITFDMHISHIARSRWASFCCGEKRSRLCAVVQHFDISPDPREPRKAYRTCIVFSC